MEVSLEAVGRSDKQIVSTRDTEKGTVFTFDNIMPGKYKGTVYSFVSNAGPHCYA